MTAREILHFHAIERYLRKGVKSLTLEPYTRPTCPRMSHDAWVTSCLLTAGVDARVLDVLGVWLCEAKGTAWETTILKIQESEQELRKEQVAVKYTLAEASWAAGHKGLFPDYPQIMKAKREAESLVAENMLRFAERAANERPD